MLFRSIFAYKLKNNNFIKGKDITTLRTFFQLKFFKITGNQCKFNIMLFKYRFKKFLTKIFYEKKNIYPTKKIQQKKSVFKLQKNKKQKNVLTKFLLLEKIILRQEK